MNKLVIASPDSQVGLLMRLNTGAESFIWQPARNQKCVGDTRQTETQALSSHPEDWLL